jgi:hypothetical protein
MEVLIRTKCYQLSGQEKIFSSRSSIKQLVRFDSGTPQSEGMLTTWWVTAGRQSVLQMCRATSGDACRWALGTCPRSSGRQTVADPTQDSCWSNTMAELLAYISTLYQTLMLCLIHGTSIGPLIRRGNVTFTRYSKGSLINVSLFMIIYELFKQRPLFCRLWRHS